jgi:hypothetical protein
MPVHKPGASGRERIPKQGCEHVPSRYRSSWKLCKPSCASPHHSLLRLFPSIESTEKQMHDFRLMTSPPIRVSLPCDIGLFLASRSILRSWRLSFQKALHALTTQAQPSTTIAAVNPAHHVSTSPTYSVVPIEVEKLQQRSTTATNRSTA